MATHPDHPSMLRESLPQFIELARRGVLDPVLGYPSVALLMTVIDIIGSYIPGDQTVAVPGVAEPQLIGSGWNRFKVLNHRFFGYSFNADEILRVSILARSPLIHHGVVPFGVELTVDHPTEGGFEFRSNGSMLISLPDLIQKCDAAVKAFLAEADEFVPRSRPARDFYQKVNAKGYDELRRAAESGSWISSESASAIATPPEGKTPPGP